MNLNLKDSDENIIKVEDFLKIIREGDVIGVKTIDNFEWDTNHIDSISNGKVDIFLYEDLFRKNIMVDDVLKCRVFKDNYEFVFDCKIDDMGIAHHNKLSLAILSVKRYDNGRRSKRYSINLCGNMTFDNHDSYAFIIVKNISETGISFTTKVEMKMNEEVDISIVLWQEQILSFEGRIVRGYKNGECYNYGVEIEYIDTKNSEVLRELLEQLESKERQVFAKFRMEQRF